MHSNELDDDEKIAVIGMSGRFPGAPDIQQYWQNLIGAKESIVFLSDAELLKAGVDEALLRDPNYVKANGVLADVDKFDADFFDYSPAEAAVMDPQHRFFIECAWAAMEHAGYNPVDSKQRVGVYAGSGLNTYVFNNLISSRELMASLGILQLAIANKSDFMPSRVSYKLNLTGPSINVNTACSTSLVAIQLASQALLNYECDMAIAGGVTVSAEQHHGYYYDQGGVASSDGHCRAFDAKANGTVHGSGIGVVVLKRLSDALKDGDHIDAVILAAAVNNDGGNKMGFAAPSVEGQIEVILEAIGLAGIDPASISYVEAHGTATSLGDPIEVAALNAAYTTSEFTPGSCALGSVKTNVGHLDAAAGVAGLIKTILCLQHKKLVPSLHYSKANTAIEFERGPFYVNTEYKDWLTTAEKRRAGISSFGIGGTNAHVIVEEGPTQPSTGKRREYELLLVSARTPAALQTATANLDNFIANNSGVELADIAYTLKLGRKHFAYRHAWVGDSNSAAASVASGILADENRTTVFMFSGIGDQYLNMAKELYDDEPVFRQAFDVCCEKLKAHIDIDLREVVFTNETATTSSQHKTDGLDLRAMLQQSPAVTDAPINQTIYLHPLVFSLEHALATYLLHLGITPRAMIGYSLGEYAAACIAGVMSLDDAIYLVATRATLIDSVAEGRMLAVALKADAVTPYLNKGINIGAINSEGFCILSGEAEALAEAETLFRKQSIACIWLQTRHAFHSTMLRPIAQEFIAAFSRVTLKPPRIPYISNLTGDWITAEQACSPQYWLEHTCSTVQFHRGIITLLNSGSDVLLEVGPGQTLASTTLQVINENISATTVRIVQSTVKNKNEHIPARKFTATLLGNLWQAGVNINWSAYYGNEHYNRVALPTYPFAKERHWIDATGNAHVAEKTTALAGLQEGKVFTPYWMRCELTGQKNISSHEYIVIGHLPDELINPLSIPVPENIAYRIHLGDNYEKISPHEYRIAQHDPITWNHALADIAIGGQLTQDIVYVTQVGEAFADSDITNILQLAKSVAHTVQESRATLTILTFGALPVLPSEQYITTNAALPGLLNTLMLEYPAITCKQIDIDLPNAKSHTQFAKILSTELSAPTYAPVIAYRASTRWTRQFTPIAQSDFSLQQNELVGKNIAFLNFDQSSTGFYLLKTLAEKIRFNLLLIAEKPLPEESEWERIAHGDAQATQREIIKRVLALRAAGIVVTVHYDESGPINALKKAYQHSDINFVILDYVKASSQLLVQQAPEKIYAHLHAHQQSLNAVHELVKEQSIQKVLLLSDSASFEGRVGDSIASLISGLHDSFAGAHEEIYTSVHYGLWKNTAANSTVLAEDSLDVRAYLEKKQKEEGLSLEQGVALLAYALTNTISRLVLSKQALPQTREQLDKRSITALLKDIQNNSAASHAHSLRAAYVAPGSDMEILIADLWQELFGINNIGANDNFFHLGGSSLLGIKLITRIRDALDVALNLRALYEHPTVAQFAVSIEKAILADIESGDEKVSNEFVADENHAFNYELPNGLTIKQFNRVETEHFYKDIFVNHVYYKNGIHLSPYDTVFDVGANIGLFTLFINRQVANLNIFSFEPAKPIYECLKRNSESLGENITLFNFGLSDHQAIQHFTFYPRSTGMSSFHADVDEEKDVLRALIHNDYQQNNASVELLEHMDEVLQERFRSVELECELRTLSSVVAEFNIEKIDLLKIDVQKCELEVLQGIAAHDWLKIRQIVIEVHDIEGRVAEISGLLQSHGFTIKAEQDDMYQGSNIWNLYAIQSNNAHYFNKENVCQQEKLVSLAPG